MRQHLKAKNGTRTTFEGTVERFGAKPAYRGPEIPTLLLVDVRFAETGEPACDHLWFTVTKGFAALDLQPGERVRFDARVKPYEKGYKGRRDDVYNPVRRDYKLSHPTRIERVKSVDTARAIR